MRTAAVLLLAVLALPGSGFAQALPSVNLTRVRDNTRKATVKPQGDLKAQIDFRSSLVLRSERTIVDGSAPCLAVQRKAQPANTRPQ